MELYSQPPSLDLIAIPPIYTERASKPPAPTRRAQFADRDIPKNTDCNCPTFDWDTGNTVWCSYRDMPNGPLKLLRGK